MKKETIHIRKSVVNRGIYAIIAMAVIISGCGSNEQSLNVATGYETSVLTLEQRTLSTSYSASIQGVQDIAIYPQITGPITQVNVGEGAIVKKGTALFVIDQAPYIAALNTAKANVSAAKAELATAQLNYDSRNELFLQQVVSEFDLRTAGNDLALAKARLEQTEAQLANAENNLSYTLIKSPSDGVVGTLPYKIGALVSPTMTLPLTTVSDNSEMFIYFSMSENQLLTLTREYGSMEIALDSLPSVQLVLSDGSLYEHPGRIENISGVIDRSTGSATLKAAFPNNGRLLRSGSTGNVLIPVKYDSCIVIPQASTYEIQDKRYVYKVVDGRAIATQITVSAINDGSEFIVTQGLNPGEVIVSAGISTLKDGMQIVQSTNQNKLS